MLCARPLGPLPFDYPVVCQHGTPVACRAASPCCHVLLLRTMRAPKPAIGTGKMREAGA